MLSKNQVKFIRSLHSRKGREEHRLFLAEGSKSVLEVAASSYRVEQVLALEEWIREHGKELSGSGINAIPVDAGEMERITALATASPALAVVRMKAAPAAAPEAGRGLTLVLDDIQDPGNLGTIIRIADWFGIGTIVCSPGTVELWNPKVIQATMGSFTRVDVFYTGLAGFLQEARSHGPVYGTFLEGTNIYSEDLAADGVIVIGNESRGISEDAGTFVTNKITIPSYALDQKQGTRAESLNAAIATAVVCAEFRRRFHD